MVEVLGKWYVFMGRNYCIELVVKGEYDVECWCEYCVVVLWGWIFGEVVFSLFCLEELVLVYERCFVNDGEEWMDEFLEIGNKIVC